jgi:hypothetical protein
MELTHSSKLWGIIQNLDSYRLNNINIHLSIFIIFGNTNVEDYFFLIPVESQLFNSWKSSVFLLGFFLW